MDRRKGEKEVRKGEVGEGGGERKSLEEEKEGDEV